MTQATMFPMTEEERIALLRGNLKRDAEKHLAKRDTAAASLADAQEAYESSLGLLNVFDHMVRDRARQMSQDQGGKSIIETAADMVNSGAIDGDGIKVTASVSPGRVADPWTCSECDGDGRLLDKTGGGHHKCKACNGTGHQDPSCDNCTGYGDCNISQPSGSDTMGCGGKTWLHGEMMGKAAEPNVSVVVALYPGSDEPVVTKIGEHTRYGELVADYFSAAGLTDKHDVKDYRVVTEDERTDRGLAATIFHADYGKRLLVVAADQGSVTGADEGASS